MRSVSILVISLFIFISSAQAGIIIQSIEQTFLPQETLNSKGYIEKDRMRAEPSQGSEQVLIFRKDKNLLWILNNTQKTYTELSREAMGVLKAKMEEALKLMEKQMKDVPPEQKALMEEMMKGKKEFNSQQEEKTEYKKVASGEKVGTWTSDLFEGQKKGVKVQEIWTVGWDQVGLDRSEIQVLEEYAQFFKDFLKDMQLGNADDLTGAALPADDKFPGFPVKTISYKEGQMQRRTEIIEIKKEAIDPSLFELPADYVKKNIDDFN